MKYLYIYIVFIFSLFNSLACANEIAQLPNDFDGELTLSRIEEMKHNSYRELGIVDLGITFYEIGKYLHNKYSTEEIFNEDFIEKLRPIFPNDDDNTLYTKQIFLQNSIKIYTKINEIYNDYIKKKISPRIFKKVRSVKDYDHHDEIPYIEADEGYFVKVYNFKKFLTYSTNAEERAAIRDFEAKNKKMSVLDKIDYIAKKIEWKKVFLYGEKYENPLLSKKGTSTFSQGKHLQARLLSKKTYIEDDDKLDFGIQIITEPNHFIIANNYSDTFLKPQIDLSLSENISEYKINYPTPFNSINFPSAHKYYGEFMIPIEITVNDKNLPLTIKAKMKFTVCNTNFKCTVEDLYSEVKIDPNGDDIFNNGYDYLFDKTISHLPQSTSPHLTLRKFVVDNDKDTQSLRLEFSTDKSIKSFKIFVEEKQGYTLFSSPLISIKDNHIFVRLIPIENNNELLNSTFTITAELNDFYGYRTDKQATISSTFDPQTTKLNMALIMFAILGGLILNFMPCVFPVLSLKIMTLSQSHNLKRKKIKTSLLYTIYGIFSGFSILTIGLIIAKFLDYSLGWGMQFQNINFLIIMTFVLSTFIAILPKLNMIDISKYTLDNYTNKTNFIIGNMIVILSTPCTGPYLATAIGFALSGNYIDIIIIMYGVAIGLSIPYIVAYIIKDPEALFPKPGPWLNKLNIAMKIMLYLTILWFLSLILGQTNWKTVFVLVISITIFTILFKTYHAYLDYLCGIFDENITLETINKARKTSTFLIITLFISLLYWCNSTATQNIKINQNIDTENKYNEIETKLIQNKLAEGHAILLEIGANWCMTCHFNSTFIFTNKNLERWKTKYNLETIKVDWTNYNKETLDFMAKYGRKGLPFYILYTPFLRDGIALPEILSTQEIENILSNYQTPQIAIPTNQ